MADIKSDREKSIGRMFDDGFRSKPEPPNFNNFDDSAKLHVSHILENNSKTVLDVGMGAGGMLLVLQERGVESVVGVELSHEGVKLATKRFEMFGDISKAVFFEGSFLDFKPSKVDAVSLHQVLHCHPNLKGMVNKAIEASPELIINTMPRKNIFTTIIINLMSLFTFPLKRFRVYAHSPKKVEKILSNHNYVKIFTDKSFFWETSLFKLKHEN